jgi:cytochrome c-type biogenesis protein CcsB
LYLVRSRDLVARFAYYATLVAFGLHSTLLIVRYISLGYFPVTNLHQSLSFFAWALMGMFIVVHGKYHVPLLGTFVTPVVTIFLILSATILTNHPIPIPPALQSSWLPIHSTVAFVGEAIFGLAFCVGIMYLIQERHIKKKKLNSLFYRLPSLETLDDLNYLCLSLGFPFLTLGIITGSLWAQFAWGSYWSWDPKETWSLITWLIYAALLHGRMITGWRGRRAALLSIIGFSAVIFTFLGVNLLLPGLHSYESLTTMGG